MGDSILNTASAYLSIRLFFYKNIPFSIKLFKLVKGLSGSIQCFLLLWKSSTGYESDTYSRLLFAFLHLIFFLFSCHSPQAWFSCRIWLDRYLFCIIGIWTYFVLAFWDESNKNSRAKYVPAWLLEPSHKNGKRSLVQLSSRKPSLLQKWLSWNTSSFGQSYPSTLDDGK